MPALSFGGGNATARQNRQQSIKSAAPKGLSKRYRVKSQASSSYSDRNVLLRRERDEALEQQAASAEILSVISDSPTDTQPVFNAIVQSGLKLFPDALISLALRDGDTIKAAAIAESRSRSRRSVATHNFPYPSHTRVHARRSPA